MSSGQKRWESVDKASIPIATLVDRDLSACRSVAMSPKSIRGYNEKLKRYVCMVGGTLGDFSLGTVRQDYGGPPSRCSSVPSFCKRYLDCLGGTWGFAPIDHTG